ncbi:MAG: RNA polymerase sigma factor [Bacteroidales bacterium]|nr:RNA polymerase sigma factor [Bacteroidales bacterium]
MNTTEYNNCVNQYADGIYRFIYKNLHNTDDSKDIVQEAFTRLWEKHNEISSEKAKSYIFTSAYHILVDKTRKMHETSLSNGQDALQTVFRQYSDIKDVLENAINKLPQDQRSVIMLRDYEGYSYDEIAEITGLSESQVKVYIFRGRTFLRKHLESQGIYSTNLEDAI